MIILFFRGRKIESLSVRVGTATHASDGLTFKVKQIVENGKYIGGPYGFDYDYVLLELFDNLNYTDKIQPIQLPKSTDEFIEGTRCLTSGWGEYFLFFMQNSVLINDF